MTLFVGGVMGGPETRKTSFFQALTAVSRAIRTDGEIAGASIDLVFLMPGSMTSPDFEGLRTGKFSRVEKTLMIQVAVPEHVMNDDEPLSFIFESARESVKLARMVFKKTKIDFDEPAYNRTINRVETELRAANE